jgi:hypothetical protein
MIDVLIFVLELPPDLMQQREMSSVAVLLPRHATRT